MVAQTRERAPQSAADAFMVRLLRVPAEPAGTDAEAQSAFQQSIVISSIRCLLTYIVFPFVAPAVGAFSSVGPIIGIALSAVAVVSITISVRRFWRVRHGKRWHYTVLASLMLVFIAVLVTQDVLDLTS